MSEIKINNELKNLLPALTPEEYKLLEISLINEGCRMPLTLWDETIIDGHNRYKICSKYNIEFQIDQIKFKNIDEAKIWIIDNQKSRRNITEGWKYKLSLLKREILMELGKQSQGTRTDLLSTVDKMLEPHNTQKEIAKELGWSTGKVGVADKVWKIATDELKDEIVNGTKSFNEAYKIVKKEEKIIERKAQIEKGKNIIVTVDFRLGDFMKVLDNIPNNSVDVIITDPPYPLEYIECWSQLSLFAHQKLKWGGFCIAYSGQYNLPEVITRMNENLRYYWTFAMYHEGSTQIVNGVNLMCRWKPVLIYQKGTAKLKNTFQDYFISESREKDGHDWQQSKSGVSYLIEMFTKVGDLIVEPFAGVGTTIIAAKEMKRNIIAAEIDENTYNIAKLKIDDNTKKT
jgi:hypothetical protein